MLQIVLWKWDQPNARTAYLSEHVDMVCTMLRRYLGTMPHRIICITDDSSGIHECETAPLWMDCMDLPNASGKHLPSCYRRLKLYDRETQRDLGIDKGDRIMGIDLDSLITGDLKAVVATQGRFVGWHLPSREGHLVFNGSLQQFTAGDLQHVWSEFNPAKSPKEAASAGFRGSDQAWISYKMQKQEGAVGLRDPLVSSYPLQNRIQGFRKGTSIIFFHGSQKPWSPAALADTPWISRYWR
jgi:hypothetical protein